MATIPKLPAKSIEGLGLVPNASNPAYQIDIAVGECRDIDDSVDIKPTSPITIDISASGANGLDTGSEAASTWYYVFIIYNPDADTIAGLFSASATTPSLPSGYTKKRRIGVVRNDSSSDLLAFVQAGRNNMRRYFYTVSTAVLGVLSGGTATSWTDVDCGSLVPPVGTLADLAVINNETSDDMQIRTNGISVPMRRVKAGNQHWNLFPCDDSQGIEYRYITTPGGSGAKIRIVGFQDEL